MPSLTLQQGRDFIIEHAEPMRAALVPELELWLARQPFDIHQAYHELAGDIPFWAFAWGGGQAVARWLLDNPQAVAGKSVLDIGAGSAIEAVAAMKAGATAALANDTDPFSCAAALLNAEANGVVLTVSQDDLLGSDPDTDVIIVGDLLYLPDLVIRVEAFLARARKRGVVVYFGDRATTRRPSLPMTLLASYRAPLTPELEIGYIETSRVWRLD